MIKSKLLKCLLLPMILFALSIVDSGAAQTRLLQGAHAQKSIMPKTCRSCHKGMAISVSGEESTCLPCHSSAFERDKMEQKGYLKEADRLVLADIEAELRKPYAHPVLTERNIHQKFETLPEEIVNAARHSECVDCHNPHVVEKDKPYRGLKGRRVGNFMAEIQKEYELCYRCHSESANLPGTSTDKHLEFKLTNPSYHPVEGEGKNTYVISLKEPYVAVKEKPGDISTIGCHDCHGSDDANGPRGPHGSNFPGLLKLNYEMEDERPESDYAYALCYKCHDRISIMNNESFPYHSQHVQGEIGGQDGTSCFTCHDAHGSTQYQHLIRFNEDVVTENADGKLKYDAQGYSARHGACYLNCHGVEHNPDIEGLPGKY